MPFEKGRNKTGGRKTGSIGPMRALKEVCAEKGFCFASKLVELAQCGEVQIEMAAVREGMKYLYPQLKEHALTGKDGGPIEVDSPIKAAIIAKALELIRAKASGKS